MGESDARGLSGDSRIGSGKTRRAAYSANARSVVKRYSGFNSALLENRNMLRIDNLRKSFVVDKGEVRAVQDVNIDIAEGQFFTLLGPSGSGKSTTLRCIAGLEQPEDG